MEIAPSMPWLSSRMYTTSISLYTGRHPSLWKDRLLTKILGSSVKASIFMRSCYVTTKDMGSIGYICATPVRLMNKFVRAAKEKSQNYESSLYDAKDVILKCISRTAEVSVLSIAATELVEEAQRRHKTAPTALAALGRALMGTLLLGSLKDDAESIQITFMGDGPIGKVITVATKEGWVKGFVGNPLCYVPPKVNGKLDVGAAVGSGMLSVSYFHPSWKQPYIGTVPIFSGEIAEDIAQYLASSEQVNTAIGLGVTFSKDGTVRSAHGFLVQILPFCSDGTLAKLEENITNMWPLSDTSEDNNAQGMLESILKDIGMGDVYTLATPRFGPCDIAELKERMMCAVACLGSSDLQQLLDEQGHVEVRCEFCAEVLCFGRTELQHIFQKSLT